MNNFEKNLYKSTAYYIHMTPLYRYISNSEFESFLAELTPLPINSRVFNTTMAGSDCRMLKIIEQGDSDNRIDIQPILESGSQVVQEHPKQTPIFGIARFEDSIYKVPTELFTSKEFLPTLHQAFYKGDYTEREADYEYRFSDDTIETAIKASDPVSRLDDNPLTIKSCEYIGGHAPRRFKLTDTEENEYYLRERSGSIKLYDTEENQKQLFNAYIGGEHPGTYLKDDEILNILDSVEYITILDTV